jgi:hypothetical protein
LTMTIMLQRFAGYLIGLVVLAGCGIRPLPTPVLPTPMSLEAMGTAIALTQNAPPAAFATIAFPRIDANLNLLSGWRAELQFTFEGVYARTTRPAATRTTAEIQFHQVASARRVVATLDNDLTEPNEPVMFEAVRLGPDVFVVQDGACSRGGENVALAADLNAGALLGGVASASWAGQRATINGEDVWAYTLDARNLTLPNVQLTAESRILNQTGELWVAPARNAVIRYYLVLEVENVLLFDNPLPLSGTLRLRYDVYEIGVLPNLNVPFGC